MLEWPRLRQHPDDARPNGKHAGRAARSMLLLGAALSISVLVVACSQALAADQPDPAAVATQPVASPTDSPVVTPTASPTLLPTPTPSPSVSPSVAVTASPTPTARPKATAKVVKTNRLDIPALRINAPFKSMSTCGGLIPNGIWRWPCAGKNNLYLLGHAWGVFAPVHDAYHKGTLKPGMIAYLTDAAGKVHKYVLQWVQDLPVATWGQGASWAATSGPTITLQTCDGASSDYRIIVRFVPA